MKRGDEMGRKYTEVVVAYVKIRFRYSSGQPINVTAMAATPTESRIHLPNIGKERYPQPVPCQSV